MTTLLLEPSLDTSLPEQYLYLENVSWECYEMLAAAASERHLQITYDSGRLEVMSPLPEHERLKYILGFLVGILALERQIPMRGLGSMTVKRSDLHKGVEPDNCFYVQNVAKVRRKRVLDFAVDPAPDLVIEVDITARSVATEPLYAALGVPELWRHDGLKLIGLSLGVNGIYAPTEMSVAFPFLRVAELNRFLDMWPDMDETELAGEFRDWVRQGM